MIRGLRAGKFAQFTQIFILMMPQICSLNVHHFLELLDQYLNQLVNDIQEAYWTGTETVLVLQHRLSYAALISLYVVSTISLSVCER